MPITITTLPTEAAVNKTFVLVSNDRFYSEHLNRSDTGHDCRVLVRQSTFLPKGTKLKLRRATSTFAAKLPVSGEDPRPVSINVSIVAPVEFNAADLAEAKDLMSFARALLTAGNVENLMIGQVGT